MTRTRYVACAVALTSTGNTIQLLPAGEFRAKDGRPNDVAAWTLDAESAAALIAASTGRDRFVIDYEHQSLRSADNGQPAPAGGWFRAMEWREGEGLFATDVEWTDKARDMIQSGEYRYLSPVLAYDRDTGAVTKIVSAALTNTPALDGMQEVSALSMTHPSEPAGGYSVTAATPPADVEALVRTTREALAALEAKTAEALKAQGERDALQRQIDDGRIETVIDEALTGARLLPGQIDAARRLGRVDFEALKALLDRPPLVPALLGMQSERIRRAGAAPAALSREELHVCALAGRSPQEFAELKRRFTTEESGLAD